MDLDFEGVILEFVRHGPVVRVSAMDPKTLTEVVVQGPASAGEADLRRAVLKKLAWVLARHERSRSRRRP